MRRQFIPTTGKLNKFARTHTVYLPVILYHFSVHLHIFHSNEVWCSLSLDPADLLRSDTTQAGSTRKRSKGSTSALRGPKLQRQRSGRGSKLQRQHSGGGAGELVDMSGIGGRDSSLFLFRALGKILHFKSMYNCC